MPLRVLKEIRSAVANLNPEEVRSAAERPLRIALVGSNDRSIDAMEEFLLPADHVSFQKRADANAILYRSTRAESPEQFDLVLCEEERCPKGGFTFYANDPSKTLHEILEQRPELGIALSRNFYPFRQPVVNHVIHSVARDNALFAVITALPDIIPSIVDLPWSIGEFASDTAFLTINQIRMAFLIAAASDKPVGYSVQKGEIASIVTGAFGWRALARELVGKVPFGVGLIPKGAIAFAGTYVAGLGLDHFHRLGYGLSRQERQDSYQAAYDRGKGIVELVVKSLRGRSAA
ncbi:MAG: hypothetical protein DMG57_37500 [Acidobacteria bacterium]|nr:MAG: hypothetical protein DMG57_37500 [Acidobacteriota bacterium]